MSKEFKLPDLGEGIHEAQIVNVLVDEGDTVAEDQMVLEVETDKAAVELPVPYAGKIEKLSVKKGDTVRVGEVLLVIADAAGASLAPPAKQTSAPALTQAQAPRASVAPAALPASHITHPTSHIRHSPPALAEAPVHGSGPIPAAPAIRRIAREAGIDLRHVHGTGPGGRIVREDVERYQLTTGDGAPPAARPAVDAPRPSAPARTVAPAPAPTTAPGIIPTEPLPDFSAYGPIRREALSQIRKTIARQMVRAATLIPSVTHGDEADVTDLESFRKEQSAIFEKQGAKLTLTAFVMKAVAGSLRQFPNLNCSYDDAAGEIIYKDYVHLGMAVDTPRGLMVPVLREVDRKGLMTISREMKEIAEKAREFKLDVSAMRGGTFTVTNVGAFGGTLSTPMINWPETAILGMGKLEPKPVVRDNQIVIRKILPLFLTFDHRVIDGAEAARFIRNIMAFLENPLNLLLV